MQALHIQTRRLGMIGYSNSEGAILLSKSPGWFKLLLKLAFSYFLDLPWRLVPKRSRRLTMGNALLGPLRLSLLDPSGPIWLQSPVTPLLARPRSAERREGQGCFSTGGSRWQPEYT